MSSVVIFSPSRYSLYTISVAELLRRQNVEVKAVIMRKLVNPDRFLSEFRRDGLRLLKKIWKKLVLRERAYSEQPFETMASFMLAEGIHFKSVDALTNAHGIPIQYCRDLNDPEVVQTLQQLKPDLVVFTGGGLIRKEVLANAGAGVVNCHMGMLPRYRGMDVVEWTAAEKRMEEVGFGVTLHRMDAGVDTAPILLIEKIPVREKDSFVRIRQRIEVKMVDVMLEGVRRMRDGTLTVQPQAPQDGRQYYVMHPRIKAYAANNLKRFLKDQNISDA